MICISIGDKEVLQGVNKIAPDMVELRYDLLGEKPEVIDQQLDGSIQRIATCRPGNLIDNQRLGILSQALKMGAGYVDVEFESTPEFIADMRQACDRYDAHLIISYHNYELTPEKGELEEVLQKSYEMGADICKIACTVLHEKDAATLLSLYNDERSKVVIGMGEKGRITRIASLFLGAPFSFAAFSDEGATAPGQYTYHKMQALFQNLQEK